MLKQIFDWLILGKRPKVEELPWERGQTDLPPDDVPLDQTTPKFHVQGDTTSF